MVKPHGTKTGTAKGGELKARTGKKRDAMTAPLDTSSSVSDSDSSCDDGIANAEECAPKTRQIKGTPIGTNVCCSNVKNSEMN